ncbi:MAG: PAS domain S-box protein [bacterium]|nr:PAS domain S-box protein [bacterium]
MNKFDIDSKEHFRLIFDQSAIGIAFLAANGRMQKVSKKLWDIFGYSEKELCEMNFLDIINPGESCKEIEQVKELFNGKFDSLWVELSYINRYEITGWISLNATLVRDREGNRSHFICIIEDTTNKKFSEIELKKKTRELERSSKYKSEFLANMSHELRSPLNSMLILSQDLASNSEKNLSEDQVKSAEIIYMGGNDLLTLINEILDLSKIEAGKMILYIDPIRVTDIAKNIELSYAHQVKKKKIISSPGV